MSTPDTDIAGVIRPFAEVLRFLGRGRAQHRIAEKFHALNRAVLDTGKAGKLTITLTVKRSETGDGLVTDVAIRSTLPEHDLPAAVYWLDRDGNPTRDDPDQLPLGGLTEVPAPTIRVSDVPAQKEATS